MFPPSMPSPQHQKTQHPSTSGSSPRSHRRPLQRSLFSSKNTPIITPNSTAPRDEACDAAADRPAVLSGVLGDVGVDAAYVLSRLFAGDAGQDALVVGHRVLLYAYRTAVALLAAAAELDLEAIWGWRPGIAHG